MKNTSYILTVILGMTLVLSCEKDDSRKGDAYTPAKPIMLTKAQENIVSCSNDFAFRMFAELEDKLPVTQPMFYSPFSLAMALAMTSCGADGNTLQQIKHVLGYGEFSENEMNESYRSLTKSILAADPTTTIAIANSVWLDEQFSIKNGFISDCTNFYSAKAQALPFGKADYSAGIINDWCAKNTAGKITKLIDAYDFQDTDFLLMNALYFNGKWKSKHVEQENDKDVFHGLNDASSMVTYMKECDEYQYAECEDCQLLELPYGNGAFVMDVLLPAEDVNFQDFAKTFTEERWKELSGQLNMTKVKYRIPEFKTETTLKKELRESLTRMGMTDAFTPIADFSGIADRLIILGDLRQMTFVDVNHKGTEAAAVTVVGETVSSPSSPESVVEFIANHPFIYLIREASTGAILFMGEKVL